MWKGVITYMNMMLKLEAGRSTRHLSRSPFKESNAHLPFNREIDKHFGT
jgi:hypothetical protein